MTPGEWITFVFVFALSVVLLVLAIRHFLGRGPLLNNAYLFAAKEERDRMEKKPYFRQSAVVFSLLSAVFFVIGLSLVLGDSRIMLLEIPLSLAAVIYAAISTVRIVQKEKKDSGDAPDPIDR